MISIGDMVRPLLRRRGLQLVRAPDIGGFLVNRGCDCVLDVGANVGLFARIVRSQDYRGKIVSFEPVVTCYNEMVAQLGRDRHWEGRRIALGDHEHNTEINVSQNPEYSSIKPLSPLGREFAKSAAPVAREPIHVRTLDQEMASIPCERPFLKIDTQGFERQVLDGAKETLGRCVGLLLELPVENLYEDVWGFTEAVSFMETMGFRPAQIVPVNSRRGDPVSAIEFDCLFRRAA